jgi:hypothetical protein
MAGFVERGRASRVTPRAELDARVENRVGKLQEEFPEKRCDTKQQLNPRRDLSWHLTFGDGRDWRSIYHISPESWEGVQVYGEKRLTDVLTLCHRWAEDQAHGWLDDGPSEKGAGS